MQRLRNVLNYARSINIEAYQLPEKYKGGRIEKYVEFWKFAYFDYKAVGIDVVKDMQTRRIRACGIFSGLGILGYAINSNPDINNFKASLLQHTCDLGMVSDIVRNKNSSNYVTYLWNQTNSETLRVLNLCFFSLMWVDVHSDSCQLYEAQCQYLKPSYFKFHKQIIDIGIFGSWQMLNYRMKDYDVNDIEWS